MSKMEIWVVKGIGNDNPEKIKVGKEETVGDLRRQYSNEFDVPKSDIELSTDTQRLTNDKDVICKTLDEGETINVLPRAKAGN